MCKTTSAVYLIKRLLISDAHQGEKKERQKPVANPDLELRRGPGYNLLAQLAFLSSVSSPFFTPNKGGGAGPAPPLDPSLKTVIAFDSMLGLYIEKGSRCRPRQSPVRTHVQSKLWVLNLSPPRGHICCAF